MTKFLASLLLPCSFVLILARSGRSDPPSSTEEKGAKKTASRTDLYGDPLPPGAIARLGTMRFRQDGDSGWFGTAFLDGGKILATGGASLRFWETASGRLLREVKGELEFPLVPSPDGKWVAIRENEALSIREVPSGRLIRRCEPAAAKLAVGVPKVFSPDGRVLVEGGYEVLRLWDTATGKEIRHFDAQKFHVGSAVFTNQGRRLVTMGFVRIGAGNLQYIIRHWDMATGKLLQKVPIDIFPCRGLRFSHDGRTVAVAPPSRPVQLLDAETGKVVRQLQGEKPTAWYLAFSLDDRLLATNSFEQGDDSATISVWNAATGKLIHRFSIPIRFADDIQFAPDGRTLLTKSEWVVKLWDANTGKLLLDWPAHESYITTLNYLPDGRTLISGSFDRTTRIWDVASGRQQRQLPFAGDADRLLPGARTILCNALPGAITVQDLEIGKVLRRFSFEEQRQNFASLVGLSSDGRTLTAYSIGATILNIPSTSHYHVWDFTTGRVLSHRQDTSGISPSIFSADGQLAAGSASIVMMGANHQDKPGPQSKPANTIGIISVVTGRQLLNLTQPDQSSQAVAFSPDAQTLLTQTSEEVLERNEQQVGKTFLHFWELRSGKERLTIAGEKSGWEYYYNAAAPSADGRKLVTVRGDATIQLWDIATGKELLRRSGYSSRVRCLAISPDGKTLASGHNDSTILVWDVSSPGGMLSRPHVEDKNAKSRIGRESMAPLIAAKPAANPKDLEAWWTDLAGADARKAHTAIWELVDHPEQAVPLLRDRLKPASAVSPEQLRQLLGDLDSKEFQNREAASKKLADFAHDVEPALERALKVSKSAEQRRRIEALLAAPRIVPAGDKLRHLRAVEVLEHIGTPDAQQILQRLSKGAPDARLTQEAKASLDRLSPKPVSLP